MGCSSSKTPEQISNEKVTKHMKETDRRDKEVLKLLLLGTGDSGKTTIFKQMRILYGEGYGEEKRANLRMAIFNNLIRGAQAIVQAANANIAGKPLTGEAKKAGDLVLRCKENVELTEPIAKAISTLWKDPNFQATWDERSNFQVLDAWGDFAVECQKFPEWGGNGWIPSVPDAIRARVRTSGIVEEEFDIDGIQFILIDVGGQRNERRKWIHVFSEVTAVIFVVAISEYDQMLFECRDKNRLQEAIELYENMINSEFFARTNFVLFLNKRDIFEHKLCQKHIPLNISGLFPDAPKGFDFNQGVDWMKRKFSAQIKDPKKYVFTHVTHALDTGNVQVVFDACKDQILRDSLEILGLMHD